MSTATTVTTRREDRAALFDKLQDPATQPEFFEHVADDADWTVEGTHPLAGRYHDKAQFVEADMYEYDISKATVMALFLLPVNMNRLAPKFFNLAPGSRIAANTFGIEGWEPDLRVTLPPSSECESWCEALLWIVPAKIAGTWAMPNGSLTLTQEYQAVQGSLTMGGEAQTVVMGRLKGEEITFSAGGLTYKGLAKGNTITGTVTTPKGDVPWIATRK